MHTHTHLILSPYHTQLLLEAGETDPVVFDDFKRSPLFIAAHHGLERLVDLLINIGSSEGIDIGKDVLTVQDIFGNTVLGEASANGSLNVTTMIFDGCPEALEVPNLRGYTPLHLAAKQGNIEIAAYLVSKGADRSKKNAFGLTPSEIARRRGFHLLSKLLVPNGKIDENSIKTASKAANSTEGRAALRTLVMNHELCLQHYTCPFPIRRTQVKFEITFPIYNL